MKSQPNIAAINTHTHTHRATEKKPQSSPETLNPIITRRKDPWKVPPPGRGPRGFSAPTARGYEVKPHHDAKSTGETSARAVGAPDPGGSGWGGCVADAGGDLGHRSHIPRQPLPRIAVTKLVAPWGREPLVGRSLLG